MRFVPVLILFLLAQTDVALAATAPPLGAVQSFAVLGYTTVTNTGATSITGDLGLSPGTSITGFFGTTANEGPGVVTGVVHQTDAIAASAQTAATAAVSAITSQACNFGPFGVTDLAGATLVPGVYCYSSTLANTGLLTLNGSGVYIFKIGSTLTTAASSIVALSNGADSANVFWQVGTTASLGASSTFKGTIIAGTSITLNTSANVSGRVLAQTEAVTLDTNTVSLPPPPIITVTKSVAVYSDPVNGVSANAKAIPGAEMLYTVTMTNSGAGTVDTGTTVITDPIPANMSMCVSTLCSNPPVVFSCSAAPACGLTYSYATAVTYSSAGSGGAFTYTPFPDPVTGYDSAVTGVKISPTGFFNGASGAPYPSFSLALKMKIN